MKKEIIAILSKGFILTDPITNKHISFNRFNDNLYSVTYGDTVNDFESKQHKYSKFESAYRYFKKI